MIDELLQIMLDITAAEIPNIKERPAYVQSITEVRMAANEAVFQDTSWSATQVREPLFTFAADEALLLAISYQECRFFSGDLCKDGDKKVLSDGTITFRSVGPQQINRGFIGWLASQSSYWEGATTAKLRQTRENMFASYAILNHLKKKCDSRSAAELIYSYTTGKCAHVATTFQSWVRCKMMKEMLDRQNVDPSFTCGHEKVDRDYTKRFSHHLKWLTFSAGE